MGQKSPRSFRMFLIVLLFIHDNLNCEAYESKAEKEKERENENDNVIPDTETQYVQSYNGADYMESPAIWDFRIEACNFMRTTCGEWFPLGKGKK